MMTCSWPSLLLQIAATFFVANGIYAIGYFLAGGIENAHSFADVYFFSVETMSTIGYGKMAPNSLISNILVSFEALTGFVDFGHQNLPGRKCFPLPPVGRGRGGVREVKH